MLLLLESSCAQALTFASLQLRSTKCNNDNKDCEKCFTLNFSESIVHFDF